MGRRKPKQLQRNCSSARKGFRWQRSVSSNLRFNFIKLILLPDPNLGSEMVQSCTEPGFPGADRLELHAQSILVLDVTQKDADIAAISLRKLRRDDVHSQRVGDMGEGRETI